ncbi:AraC family transcriptional regulator [Salinicola halophilus]|uniref:AraC family transcriptional regulator n=1 Tax=Salinicola halophilus TaxID=184065 RepID=UPI0019550668|nr:AraC family transcriptional regulator [Salinicola halophilus]
MILIDMLLGCGIDSHKLLRGTGLFHEDLLTGEVCVSPRQFLGLIGNARQLLKADDLSFLYGQRLLPGHYGAASHALCQVGNLEEALTLFSELRNLLTPLVAPRLIVEKHTASLYWVDAYGCGDQWRFLLEAGMVSVTSACRWLASSHLPWRFEFAHSQPAAVEQYWVHLDENVHFDCQVDRLSIPIEFLHQAWPGGTSIAASVARQQSERQVIELGARDGLLGALQIHFEKHIREPLNLHGVAEAFGCSPTTFKRKLKKHGTHFQQQLDLSRKRIALHLYRERGYANEQVAAYLRFNDATNFRRSFKRWTGVSPHVLKQDLG